MTWIIEFRGDLSETAPLNMDGSTSLRAVSLTLGKDLPTALTNLLTYTKGNGIRPTHIIKCLDLENLQPTSDEGFAQEDINEGLLWLSKGELAHFTYAISSEAENAEGAIFIEAGR